MKENDANERHHTQFGWWGQSVSRGAARDAGVAVRLRNTLITRRGACPCAANFFVYLLCLFRMDWPTLARSRLLRPLFPTEMVWSAARPVHACAHFVVPFVIFRR